MSTFNKLISKARKRKRSKDSLIYVPNLNFKITEKRFINLLDRVSNKTADFIGLIKTFHSLPMSPKMKLPPLGNRHDCYRIEHFSQTAINQLDIFIQNTIEFEYQVRLESVETETEYLQLISLDLTPDLKSKLDEFSTIKQDEIISKAKVSAEGSILPGLQAEKRLLEAENELHELRKAKYENNKEYTEKANIKFDNNNHKTDIGYDTY